MSQVMRMRGCFARGLERHMALVDDDDTIQLRLMPDGPVWEKLEIEITQPSGRVKRRTVREKRTR